MKTLGERMVEFAQRDIEFKRKMNREYRKWLENEYRFLKDWEEAERASLEGE